MPKTFTKEELFIIEQDYYLVDEVVVDIRKGIPQTRYVINVGCNDKDCLIDFPEHLKGLWMQDWATDNTYDSVSSRLKDEGECWVKCKEVEVTTYEYQEIE